MKQSLSCWIRRVLQNRQIWKPTLQYLSRWQRGKVPLQMIWLLLTGMHFRWSPAKCETTIVWMKLDNCWFCSLCLSIYIYIHIIYNYYKELMWDVQNSHRVFDFLETFLCHSLLLWATMKIIVCQLGLPNTCIENQPTRSWINLLPQFKERCRRRSSIKADKICNVLAKALPPYLIK